MANGCNVEHVVTDNLGQTKREKKNPVRRPRQFRAEKKKKKLLVADDIFGRKKKKKVLSVEVPKPRFQDLALRTSHRQTHYGRFCLGK
jgi:hypothetical protein